MSAKRDAVPPDVAQKLTQLNQLSVRMDRDKKEAQRIKMDLLALLKAAGLTGTKFNFDDRSIRYAAEPAGFSITQGLLKSVLAEKYPEIDSRQFIAQLKAAKPEKIIEKIQIVKSRGGSEAADED